MLKKCNLRWIMIVLVSVLCLSLFTACAKFQTPEPTATPEPRQVRLQFLATSDTHGWFRPYNYVSNKEDSSGSLAQVATVVKELRDDNTLVIDVGDLVASNAAGLFTEEAVHPMVVALNEIGYDFAVPGNHDFNYGKEWIQNRIATGECPFLCGNVYLEDGSSLGSSYEIIEKDGVKIGIIGMVTPHIQKWDAQNLEGWTVTDPVEETKKCVAEIRDQVDVLIAVEHMDIENELGTPNTGIRDLAEACPELDLIIASHGHNKIDDMEINGIPVIENANYAKTIGQVVMNLKENGDKWDIEDVSTKLIETKDYQPDEGVLEKTQTYHDMAVAESTKVIGVMKSDCLAGPDDMKGIHTSWVEDAGVADLILNSILEYYDVDVAATALFNYDANLYKGDIRNCDLADIYPYDNMVTILKMNGAQLKKWMEWSANFYNTPQEGDLTVSFNKDVRLYLCDFFAGVKYEIDISQEPGNRIKKLRWPNGKEVKDTDEFTVAVSDYRANSQLTCYGSVFSEGDPLPVAEESTELNNLLDIRSCIKLYITDAKEGVLKTKCDRNWKLTGFKFNKSYRKKAAKMLESGELQLESSEDGRTPNIKAITIDDVKAVEAAKK